MSSQWALYEIMDHLLDDIEGDRDRHGWKTALQIHLHQHAFKELKFFTRRRSPGYYVARMGAISSQNDLRGQSTLDSYLLYQIRQDIKEMSAMRTWNVPRLGQKRRLTLPPPPYSQSEGFAWLELKIGPEASTTRFGLIRKAPRRKIRVAR